MRHEPSIDIDSKSKRTHFVELGFILSLVILFLLLGLMRFGSVHNLFTTTYVVMDLPLDLGKAENMVELNLPQQQSAPPKEVTPPTSALLDIVADNSMVSKDITLNKNANIKSETKESTTSGNSSGTNGTADTEDPTPFSIVEDQPTFPQGTDALLKYLRDNIRYPYAAKQAGISGTVIVSFVVEKDGSISSVKLVHGIGADCNKEAIRVVSMMPKWTPGKQRGIPVRVQFQIPLIFYLHAS